MPTQETNIAKLRFTLTAGALWRGKIRKSLEKAKSDILYETKAGHVDLIENKTLLESEFTFVVTNLTDPEALVIQKGFQEYVVRTAYEYLSNEGCFNFQE